MHLHHEARPRPHGELACPLKRFKLGSLYITLHQIRGDAKFGYHTVDRLRAHRYRLPLRVCGCRMPPVPATRSARAHREKHHGLDVAAGCKAQYEACLPHTVFERKILKAASQRHDARVPGHDLSCRVGDTGEEASESAIAPHVQKDPAVEDGRCHPSVIVVRSGGHQPRSARAPPFPQLDVHKLGESAHAARCVSGNALCMRQPGRHR
jgi:hypothetical protein